MGAKDRSGNRPAHVAGLLQEGRGRRSGREIASQFVYRPGKTPGSPQNSVEQRAFQNTPAMWGQPPPAVRGGEAPRLLPMPYTYIVGLLICTYQRAVFHTADSASGLSPIMLISGVGNRPASDDRPKVKGKGHPAQERAPLMTRLPPMSSCDGTQTRKKRKTTAKKKMMVM